MNFVRSANLAGDDWTTNELSSYNIKVQHATTTPTLFSTTDLPETPVSDSAILNHLKEPASDTSTGPLTKSERKFFQLMDDVEYPDADESAVPDFALFLLSLLDYDHGERRLHTNKEMADVVLMDRHRYLLLLQEYKYSDDPEPRLIAACIAAARANNVHRFKSCQPPLERQVMLGIIMVGTAPIFYHTIVTTALIDAVRTSTSPAELTIVSRSIPPVPNPARYVREGMRPLEHRRVVFQHLEAFKASIVQS